VTIHVAKKTSLLSTTYTVTVAGTPGARVAISVDGRAWRTVTLGADGRATEKTSSIDLLGLLGGLSSALGAGDFSARYV